MKKLFYAILMTCCAGIASAQFPQKINYQAVARDAGGMILANQNICLIIKITDGSGGPVLYSENHNLNTNQFGLFTLAIGGGDTAAFAAIDWTGTSPWLDVSMDIGCTSSFTPMGVSQLLSVPYALNAISSLDNHWVKNGNDLSNNNPGAVGIGTATPTQKLDVIGYIKTKGIIGDGIDPLLINSTLPIYSNAYSFGWNVNSSTYLSISNAGKVGVNTGAPAQTLDVNGVTRTLGIENQPASALYLTSTSFMVSDAYAYQWMTNGVDRMYMDNTGAIGIGTLFPAQRLHVSSGDIMQETVVGDDWVYIGTGTVAANNVFSQPSRFISSVGGNDLWASGRTLGNDNNYHISNYASARFYDLTVAEATGNVGIGTASPGAKLEVAGQVKITGGSPGAGKVLTSDATGLATWEKGTIIATGSTSNTVVIGNTCNHYAGAVVTITVPAGGTIVVECNAWVQLNHTSGTTDLAYLMIDNSASACNANTADWVPFRIPSSLPSAGQWDMCGTVRRVFTVATAGTYNYYLNGYMPSGNDASDVYWFASLVAKYHP
jgi:hypothetical protein